MGERLAAAPTPAGIRALLPILLSFLVALASASPASAAVTQKQAADRAIDALGADKGESALIVFGLPSPVAAGTPITQAGTPKPVKGTSRGLPASYRTAGVTVVKAPKVLTASRRSYLFYEDRGPFQLYQHPGRVALVDVKTGKVTLSKTITWPPLVGGKLPAFLKSAGGYRSSKYQVLYRPWKVPGATQRTRPLNRNLFDQDPFGPGRPLPSRTNAKAIADRLAAERSCVLRVTDTLPAFWDVNELNMTRTYVGTLFAALERENRGFIDDRYGARSGETLAEAVDRMVDQGCKDLLLYIAGQGYSSGGEPVIHLGTSSRRGGLVAQQNISASALRAIVAARPETTFKFSFDAPYAGGMIARLRDLQNVLLVQTAAAPGDEAFAFVPQVENSRGQMVDSSNNPAGLLEATNCAFVGLKSFFDSTAEIDRATQGQNEGVSFLAEMLARSQELCNGDGGFADDLGASPQLYAQRRASGSGTNRPPKADPQNVTTTEDTAKSITLTGSDPDGDTLTYSITKPPDHGTLSGSGSNVTYTPDGNYSGPDDFSFKVEDGKGASNTAKIDISVTAANDAPVVSNSQNAAAYTEQAAAVVVDANLTVSDIDDTQLEGATVRVSSGFQSGDALVFTDQLGITGTYNSGTGVLTLTGTASVSDYRTALRDVRYRNLTNDDPSSAKTIEFKANDGSADSAASTKNIAVTGVNDAPTIDFTNGVLTYIENDGAVAIDPAVSVTDPDTQLNRAEISVTSGWQAAQDDLAWTDNDTGDSITLQTDDDAAGELVLAGTGTPAQYAAAVAAVTYANNSDNPNTTPREVTGEVRDTGALVDGDTRTINVDAVNDPPVANNDTATVNEDSSGTGNDIAVLSNDSDVESDTIEITDVSNPPNGTATIVQGSPDKVNYVPDANYCGTDTFEYTVNGGDTATVTVTVTCSDDPPVANNDTATVNEDTSGTGNDIAVLSNDADVENDAIEITNVTDPANGTATIVQGSPDKVNYVPDANYCNSQSGGTPDTFEYTVNGGDTATASVTVTCVDDATNAENDTVTVNEDSGANTVNVRNNDTDADLAYGGSKELVTGKTDGTNGTVAITSGGASVSYTPNSNYCGSDSFTYTLAGGDTATVNVTVTCFDDNAVANDDTATVNEDSSGAGNDIAVLSNDTDVENDAIEIANITDNPDHGSATIVQGTPDKINYVPTADYCGPDSLTYEVNGGDTATVSITVTCANDAPIVDLNGASAGLGVAATFNEQSGGGSNNQPVALAPNLDTADVDDTHLEGATVTLTNEQNAGQESLAVNQVLATSKGIAVAISVDGDTITLTSTTANSVTKQDYEDLLRTVTYNNTADTPSLAASSGTDRTVTFKVSDGTADSATATATVEIVPLNIAPALDLNGAGSGENEAVTFTEDGTAANLAPNATTSDTDDTNYEGATITLTNAQDSSAESISVSNAGAPCVQITNNSSQAITLSGDCPSGDYQTVLRTATYSNTSETPNTTTNRTVEFKVNDGQADSLTRTSTVTVANNNDAPVVGVPGAQSVDEDGTEQFASTNNNTNISVADPDDNGGEFKYTLSVTQGTLTLGDTTGVSFTDGTANGQSTLIFTATEQAFNSLTTQSSLFYEPSDNFNGVDTLTVTANDQGNSGGGGAKSDTETVMITVNAVNDAPTNTVPGGQSVDEDTDLTFSPGNGNALSIADVDAGTNDVRVTLSVGSSGRLSLDPADIAALNFACSGCSGDGTSDPSMVFEGTVAEVNAALDGAKYRGAQDFNGADVLTITTNDKGNTGSGGAKQDQDTVNITVNPVNDAPSADSETFGGAGNLNDQAHGNTTMQVDDTSGGGDDKSAPTNPHTEIQGDILDGDTDPDGPGPIIVQSAGSDAGATNGQTADGGTVTIESDGDFVYQPPATVSCDNGTDSFNYKISDQQNSGAGPIPGTAVGTVTIHLEGCVWYVNNNAAGNAGTSTQPFDTLAQAETASGANHTVFVYDGDNTVIGYQTGFAMNSGERLIGEHEGLTHDQDQGGAMTPDSLHPANPGAHPTISATNEDVVALDDGNEVRGFNMEPTGTGSGIAGASGDTGGGTIDDVNVVDTAVAGSQPLLELDSTTGTFNVSNFVANNQAAVSPPNTATGVRLNNAGTVNFNETGQISIGINGAKGLDAIGTNMGSGSAFDDITVAGSPVGGVNLLNTTGTTTFGDGTGSDLSLTTTSGSDAALRVSNGGTVSVAAAGADDLHATGGPALDSTGTSGALYEFDDVDSTNSANDGINIDGLGTGTFSASSGDIGGAAGFSFDLNGGSGAITYPGNLNNGGGTTAIEVTGRSGGAVTLSGPISDTNDAGGGLNLSSNTGGSTTLSNGTKQFNTGAADAINFASSDGHTLTLSGGNLDIDATTGNGFTATTAGTIEVSGSGNTIDKTGAGGRGINISDTDIAANDVTFQRIRTDGALTGIRLNSTGNTGNLAVTGNGGTCTNASTSGCSGGEIENGTGGDSSSATPDGSGVVLNDTLAPTLTRMWIHDHSNYGIRGTAVSGFNLDNSVINGANGTNDAGNVQESSVLFSSANGLGQSGSTVGLEGSASFTNNHIAGGYANNVRIRNDAGTLNRVTFTSNTFGLNSTVGGNDSVHVGGLGSATVNATLNNNTLTGAKGDVFQMSANGTGGGDLDYSGNAVSNSHSAIATGGGGVTLDGGGTTGSFNFDIDNSVGTNTFRDAKTSALTIIKQELGGNASGGMTGTINGAQIGVAASANSGSVEGSGIELTHGGNRMGTSTATVNITNNQIRQYNTFGISLVAGLGGGATNGSYNLNVTGNTVSNPGNNAAIDGFQGVALNNGTAPGDDYETCFNLKGNTVAGSGLDGGHDIRVRSRFNGNVRLPGYAGSVTDPLAIATFLANQNDGNPNSPGAEPPAPTASTAIGNPPDSTFSGGAAGNCP